jgi:hypothetical protein
MLSREELNYLRPHSGKVFYGVLYFLAPSLALLTSCVIWPRQGQSKFYEVIRQSQFTLPDVSVAGMHESYCNFVYAFLFHYIIVSSSFFFFIEPCLQALKSKLKGKKKNIHSWIIAITNLGFDFITSNTRR